MNPWPKNEHEVETLLQKYFRVSGVYDVNPDLTVSVRGSVKFMDEKVDRLPVRFREVTGNFDCSYSSLVTLDGAPVKLGGNLIVEECELVTLEYSPSAVQSFKAASGLRTETLSGGPATVTKDYDCSNGSLKSLHGAPQVVPGMFDARNNPLETLKGLPLQVGNLELTYTPTLPLLHVALVDFETAHLAKAPNEINKIFKAHKGRGRAGVPAVQNDLIDAGFINNAKF